MPILTQRRSLHRIERFALVARGTALTLRVVAEPIIVRTLDQPPLFVCGEWQRKVAAADGRLAIHGGVTDTAVGELRESAAYP
jgi:hypothetical protein